MSDFKEMTYEQMIGKAFFDLSQEIANTEIKKLRRQIKILEAENLALKQANGAEKSPKQALHKHIVSNNEVAVCAHPEEYHDIDVEGYRICKLCLEWI